MGIAFPGESREYRGARDRLLEQEIELRRAMEAVAAARRELPPGGVVPEDYVFQGADSQGAPTDVRLSELFAPGKNSLAIYSFMYPRDPGDRRPGPVSGQTARLPLDEGPCPSCVALLDQLDGAADHVSQHLNLAVVAKAPLPRLLAFGRGAWLAAAEAAVLGCQQLQPGLPRRDRGGSTNGRCSPCSTATATRSATSGARSSSTRRPTPARSHATSEPSSLSGTCST